MADNDGQNNKCFVLFLRFSTNKEGRTTEHRPNLEETA